MVMRLKQFKTGQRVRVATALSANGEEDVALRGSLGTVRRLRREDDGAWVALDERFSGGTNPHPFPEDDETRATHVLTYPDNCEAAS